MIEWDISALDRKFSKTLSCILIDGVEKEWVWIKYIGEDGWVYGAGGVPLGTFKTEDTNYDYTPDTPKVEFLYKPIICGWYNSTTNFGKVFYNVTRRHCKSFKIGFSDDGYFIDRHDCRNGLVDTLPLIPDINLSSPVTEYTEAGPLTIFKPDLSMWKGTLQVYDYEVGMASGNKLLLVDKEFTPVVKKRLGETWQIVDL